MEGTVDGYTGKLNEAWPAIALSCAGFFAVWIPVTLALRRCSGDARRHGYGDNGSFEITSMIHCTVVLYRATVVISGMSWEQLDDFYAFSPYIQDTFSFMSGYFLWDLLVTLATNSNPLFALHALWCLTVYLMGQYPFLHYIGTIFILFEASTIFLNLRRLLSLCGLKETRLYRVNETVFGLVFITVRTLCGVPMSIIFLYKMLSFSLIGANGSHPPVHSYFVVVCNIISNVALTLLNIHWTRIILKKACQLPNKSDRPREESEGKND